jgi:nucleoside-diphosphate-sugar epimerase
VTKTISIIGCGWLGLPLAKSLVENNMTVKGSTTSAVKLALLKNNGINPYLIKLNPTQDDVSDFFKCDIIVINIPPRNQQEDDYFHEKQLLYLKQEAIKSGIKNIIFISSTSVYPNSNSIVTEIDATYEAKSRAGISLLKMEDIFRNDTNFSSTIIRFAGLIGPERHPGRFFSNDRPNKGGTLPVNLVHLDDCINVIEKIIEEDIWNETFQVATPDHPLKKDFYSLAADKLGRPLPQFIEEPPLGFKIVNSDWLIARTGYKFKYQRLVDCL